MDSVSFQVLTNAQFPNPRHCWLWPHVPAATDSYWTSEPASSSPLQFVPFPLPPHSPFCHESGYTTAPLLCPWSILLGSVSSPSPSPSSCIFVTHMGHSCSLGARPSQLLPQTLLSSGGLFRCLILSLWLLLSQTPSPLPNPHSPLGML